MRSAAAYKAEIDTYLGTVDALLDLSQDDTLPDSIKQTSSFSALFVTLSSLKEKIQSIRDKVDKYYWLNEGEFEKKALLIHEKMHVLRDRLITTFNHSAQVYVRGLLEDGLPASRNELETLNALVEAINFEGEYHVPSDYCFEKQLACIRYFEKKAKKGTAQLLVSGDPQALFYERLVSRLSGLSVKLLSLTETALDKREEEELTIKQEVQLKCDAIRGLIDRKTPTDDLDFVVYSAELSNALSSLADYYSDIIAYNVARLKMAKSLLGQIDAILPRFKVRFLSLQTDNENTQVKAALIALQSAIIHLRTVSQALREDLAKIKKTNDYNAVSEKIELLKSLKSDLFKANRRYEEAVQASKSSALIAEKKCFLAEYWDFKHRVYPTLKRRILLHRKEGILEEHKVKTYLTFMLDAQRYLNSMKKSLRKEHDFLNNGMLGQLSDRQYQSANITLKRLKYRLFSLNALLKEKESVFFQDHDIAIASFREKYKNQTSFYEYLGNTTKVMLIDGWIENIKHLSRLHPDPSHFNAVLDGCRAFKLRCNKPYSDYQFANDAVRFLRLTCNESALISLSRYQNEPLYHLRMKIFKPLYDFCYRLGFFRERSISLFGCPVETQMREMIYQARIDCFHIQKGNQPVNGAYADRTLSTAFVLGDTAPIPA